MSGGAARPSSTPPHLVSSLSSSNQRWCLFLDFSNAFNCISRESMFVEIRRRIPSLAVWMESCYSCQPFLHLGEHSLLSCCGVQQGDPLGPLGFALTLQPLIERLKADVSGLNLNVWYLDDGTLMGSPEDLAAALHIVESEGPPLASTSTATSPSSSSRWKPTLRCLLYLQTSPSPAMASPSWDALSVPQTTVRRSFRPGCRR